MESLIDAPVAVFIGVTLVLFGGASWLTGQALAGTWRPVWQAFIYGPLLAAVDRFLIYALFEGDLASLPAYLLVPICWRDMQTHWATPACSPSM